MNADTMSIVAIVMAILALVINAIVIVDQLR